MCRDCYNDYYATCERCGRIIHQTYSNYNSDNYYCGTCWEEIQSEIIHEYSYKPDPIFYGSANRFFGVELEIDHGGKDYDNAEALLAVGNSYIERIYIWNEVLRFGRRTESQMAQWAARYGYKNNPKEILEHAKVDGRNRYYCVNISNDSTIELRIIRDTIKYNTLIATLELVDKICEYAIRNSDEDLAKISWSEFVISLDKNECSKLIACLKQRRLYVNAPTNDEEDL